MNRRSFLRSVGAAVAVVFARAKGVGAVEAAPAEEEPFDCTWLCKGDGCWHCRYTHGNTHCIKRGAGQIWESQDGGKSWHKTGYYPYSILTEHRLRETQDGGETWTVTEEGWLDEHWTSQDY